MIRLVLVVHSVAQTNARIRNVTALMDTVCMDARTHQIKDHTVQTVSILTCIGTTICMQPIIPHKSSYCSDSKHGLFYYERCLINIKVLHGVCLQLAPQTQKVLTVSFVLVVRTMSAQMMVHVVQDVRTTGQGTSVQVCVISFVTSLQCFSQTFLNILECVSDRWGIYCERVCPEHCMCDKLAGCTQCTPGWYGEKCENQCEEGCKDGECGKVDRKCQCKSGYTGSQCQCRDTCSVCSDSSGCTACKNGYYGEKCKSSCNYGCDQSCDKTNGNCECKDGYYGKKCEATCSSNCIDSKCDDETEECECQIFCSACKPGFFGRTCDQSCSFCEGGTCDQETGECQNGCKSGRFGSHCYNICVEPCESGNCDQQIGQCEEGKLKTKNLCMI